MTTDQIPTSDADFDIFQKDVISTLSTNKAAWGIPTANITALTTAQTTWDNAWQIAQDKGNRTAAQIASKKLARTSLEKLLRQNIQQWVQTNPLVSDDQKIGMGIKPRDKSKSSVPVPDTIPLIELKGGNGNVVKVFFKQAAVEAGSSNRAKPAGVDSCYLAYKLGDPVPQSPADCPLNLVSGRSPVSIPFQTSDAGKRVYVFGRWMNTTKKPGAWTPVASSMIVPG